MNIKNEAESLIKNSDTSCLVSLPQGKGLVFIVSHTVAGELQSSTSSNRKDIFLHSDATVTQNNSRHTSSEKVKAV